MNQRENAALAERSARRALYSCLFSIVVCAVMLFGTTFAWFTANRTSGVNTMTAANFDVSNVSITGPDSGSNGSGSYTVSRDGGSSAWYCVVAVDYDGDYEYNETVVVPAQGTENGEGDVQESTTTEAHSYADRDTGTHKYYIDFDDETNSALFTITLNNPEGEVKSCSVVEAGWNSYDSSVGDASEMPDDNEISLGVARTETTSGQQAAPSFSASRSIKSAEIQGVNLNNPSEIKDEDENGTDNTESVNNTGNPVVTESVTGGDNDGGDSGSGSGSSGGGSGAGGSTGESSGGEGGGGESSSSGTVTGTDTGTGDTGSTGNGDADTGDTGSTGNGDET